MTALATGENTESGLLPDFHAEYLNQNCHCRTLDKAVEEYPQYFSPYPHFVSQHEVEMMQAFIRAYETMLEHPTVRSNFLQVAGFSGPPLQQVERGVFNSYDFHMTDHGPQLIEINSNAAGGMLGLYAAEKRRLCCDGVASARADFDGERIVQMFRSEHARRFPQGELRSMAIVDENPREQFFYNEFLLLQQLLKHHGISAHIAAPEELAIQGTAAYLHGTSIDLVYNRLTDFFLEQPASATLREIWQQGIAAVSPNPAVYALYARKTNLAAVWSADFNSLENITAIRQAIPETRLVTKENSDWLWQNRKQWFFKPAGSFGGKGAYRGEKITTKVWEHIKASGYIAQKFVPARERRATDAEAFKYDIRVYTYGAEILGFMARYYQGQTTNFRTANGGLAHVLVAA